MFCEPLSGWRQVTRGRGGPRSIGPWKWRTLLERAMPTCEKVILVCDNLNTHTKGAFYEAFEPEQGPRDRPPHWSSATRPSTAVG